MMAHSFYTSMARYRARPTYQVMPVGMNYLSELVVRPGMKTRMNALCLYRGSMYPGRALRYWNFGLLMYAAEAETLADGLKLQNNEAFAQLCGPSKPITKVTLNSFFGRLWDNPEVTRNISGFTDYVRSLQLGPSRLTPVDVEGDRQFVAPWRVSTHPEFDPKAERPESGTRNLFYPYLKHDPKSSDGRDLVLLVNELVTRALPDQVRADVCQDLAIAILSGEINAADAHDWVNKHVRDVFKQYPAIFAPGAEGKNYRATSFDQPASQNPEDDRSWQERV